MVWIGNLKWCYIQNIQAFHYCTCSYFKLRNGCSTWNWACFFRQTRLTFSSRKVFKLIIHDNTCILKILMRECKIYPPLYSFLILMRHTHGRFCVSPTVATSTPTHDPLMWQSDNQRSECSPLFGWLLDLSDVLGFVSNVVVDWVWYGGEGMWVVQSQTTDDGAPLWRLKFDDLLSSENTIDWMYWRLECQIFTMQNAVLLDC